MSGLPGHPIPWKVGDVVMTQSGAVPDVTGQIICWALSKPVLMRHLREIAIEGLVDSDSDQELICTVVDLLDPNRSNLWREFLRAAGVQPVDADLVWIGLGGDCGWMNHVHWDRIRQALLNQDDLIDLKSPLGGWSSMDDDDLGQ